MGLAVDRPKQNPRRANPRGVGRRRVLAGLTATAFVCYAPGAAAKSTLASFWPVYRQRFVQADGRVIDSFRNGVSHSESQGWGMLLAAAAGDWPAFDRIWAWTKTRLLWRGAPLFAWSWDPAAAQAKDVNNATDGDILIAWALARAAAARNDAGYGEAARKIAVAVRRLLVDSLAGQTVLLPGLEGFRANDSAVLNLSYYVFPAFSDLARLDPSPVWATLAADGQALARRARFGKMDLPPDWLTLAGDGSTTPADGYDARFGYDAVRVPLYLAWAGQTDAATLDVYRRAWRSAEPPPAWFALDGGPDAGHGASPGVLAIRDVIEGRRPRVETVWSAVREGAYYAASLALLAMLAAEEYNLP